MISYYNIGCALIWPTLMMWTKRDWRGQEHLGLPGQGVVVAANHLSWFDPLLLLHYSNDANRPARFLAKDSLFELPMVGTIMEGAGAIPVHRESSNAGGAVRSAVKAVRNGEAIWVYPEGTITRDPELWPMMGKSGAARIALESGAPVVPVAHWGVQDIMGPYQYELNLLPRKTIQVTAGEPVDLDDLRGRRITRAVLETATTRILDRITAIEERLRREQAPIDRWSPTAKKRIPVLNR